MSKLSQQLDDAKKYLVKFDSDRVMKPHSVQEIIMSLHTNNVSMKADVSFMENEERITLPMSTFVLTIEATLGQPLPRPKRTRLVPKKHELGEIFVDSYEMAPISVVDDIDLADNTFTFHVWDEHEDKEREINTYFTSNGRIISGNNVDSGRWSVVDLESPEYIAFQQPGMWGQITHAKHVMRAVYISIDDLCFNLMMFVLHDESTGLLYLQERESIFHNVGGKIKMMDFKGKNWKLWGSN
jgi:hypothetical protein